MDPILLALAFGSAFCFALALVLTQFGLRTVAPMDGARVSVPVTALVFLMLSPLTVGFSPSASRRCFWARFRVWGRWPGSL